MMMRMMYNMINMMNICPSCKYEWKSRVENPKSCPMCKRYLKIPSGKIFSKISGVVKGGIYDEFTREPIDE